MCELLRTGKSENSALDDQAQAATLRISAKALQQGKGSPGTHLFNSNSRTGEETGRGSGAILL